MNLDTSLANDDFWTRAQPEPNSGCLLWRSTIKDTGYAKYRGAAAHRVAYELVKGPIPAGLVLDHLCRVRCCVNPAHLEAVTQQENVRRGNAGKGPRAPRPRKQPATHCMRGHEFTAENTGRNHSGTRFCILCRRNSELVKRRLVSGLPLDNVIKRRERIGQRFDMEKYL